MGRQDPHRRVLFPRATGTTGCGPLLRRGCGHRSGRELCGICDELFRRARTEPGRRGEPTDGHPNTGLGCGAASLTLTDVGVETGEARAAAAVPEFWRGTGPTEPSSPGPFPRLVNVAPRLHTGSACNWARPKAFRIGRAHVRTPVT